MSIPVLTFGCTACDLKAWDTQTWGYRFYKADGKQFRMRVAMGWCQSCCALSAVEIKPNAGLEAQLVAKIAQLRIGLEEQLIRTPPTRRWWQLMAIKSSEVMRAEYKLADAQKELASLRQLLPLMASRRSGHRCLGCGSEDCLHISPPPVEASFDHFHPAPVPLGISHPGCGGEFTVCSDGLCLSVQTVQRAYDLDGRLLPEVSEQS